MSNQRPDSPCIAICDTLYKDVCTGCGRHFTEVSQWTGFTQEQKDRVWERIEKEMTAKRFTTYSERADISTGKGNKDAGL